MRFAFEEGEEGLSHDRRISVIHLLEENVTPDGRIIFLGKQFVDQKHFTKG